MPVHPHSAAYVATVGGSSNSHADFGSDPGNGIPINTVPGIQPKVPVSFRYQSDAGRYPIPANPLVESGSDHHILIVDNTNCIDYEIFSAIKTKDSWSAGSGAIFPLGRNRLRPSGWTSADAAGLPILPGLVRYDEVASGHINHALRFTAPVTANSFIWPARHEASSVSGTQYPPMGLRFRLKQSFDVSSFGPHVQVILDALKTYGMILADNGAAWFVSGAPDPRWSDDELHQLTQVKGSNFEAVDESALMVNADSGQASTPPAVPASAVPTNTWLTLVSMNSGKCLHVSGGPTNTQMGSKLQQWSCNGGSNQAMELVQVGGGYKVTVESSGLQLDVAGGPAVAWDGAPVIQYPYWGGANEIWNPNPKPDGSFTLVALSSGKCLDVSGVSASDGAVVQQWTCTGGPNQEWELVSGP